MSHIKVLLNVELEKIERKDVHDAIVPLLVCPRCELRAWDYEPQGQKFPCWIVLEHPSSNTCIAYCDKGFGPSHSWGVLFISGPYMTMGMDSGWFQSLEEAFLDSMAWESFNTVH